MSEYPNLKGAATTDLVEQVKAGSYSASYINWSRTMQLLRDEAPGWLPELVQTAEGGYVHRGGVGGFLLIRFVHADGTATPGFPQAIMDNRNASIPLDKITSRDITDTHRRGVCMAAALAFGLAYELWAKMPLESGYADKSAAPSGAAETSGAEPAGTGSPNGGEQATPGRESAPGVLCTQEQLAEVDSLIETLAPLRNTTPEQVYAAIERDGGPIGRMNPEEAEALLGKLRRWKQNLKASAGEPQAKPEASGLDAEGAGATAASSPAEQSTFEEMAQRAQAAEKAKKAKAA